MPSTDFARDKFIIDHKVALKEELARYHEMLGVNHVIMRCLWPGLPVEQMFASIRGCLTSHGRRSSFHTGPQTFTPINVVPTQQCACRGGS